MDPKNPFRGSPRAVQRRFDAPEPRPLFDEMVVEHVRGQLLAAFREGDADHESKTHETANLVQLAECYAAIARGEWPALAELMADNVDMAVLGAPGIPFVGHWRGREQATAAIEHNAQLVSRQRSRILWVSAQQEQVMVGTVETGTFRATGKRYEIHRMQAYRFQGGRVAYLREFCDSASLIEASK